ncbi:hypothetical protein [Flavobacterium frigoris]|uniref:Uncharacterized protein n=1 Tax=Flavobacterium frigoris TaxID=229204 RepID=A0A1H9JCW2_FLAFI|nr:hypothetical protein [Flavobacterium frigoris]SEQ84672.1 hypothetical protein SAMN05444355_104286 [Flavobacterium frigoris]
MKNTFKLFLVLFLIFNIMGSIVVTIVDLYKNRYFQEYENLKSLKNGKLYMTVDFLFIKSGTQDRGSDNGIGSYVIQGTLLSNNSEIELAIGKQEFLGTDLRRQPLYRSKLTGDFFLKNAPEEYYNYKFISFYIGIYLKFSFYIIIGIVIYLTIKHIKNRKYRI